jgi:hypothetical protein
VDVLSRMLMVVGIGAFATWSIWWKVAAWQGRPTPRVATRLLIGGACVFGMGYILARGVE